MPWIKERLLLSMSASSNLTCNINKLWHYHRFVQFILHQSHSIFFSYSFLIVSLQFKYHIDWYEKKKISFCHLMSIHNIKWKHVFIQLYRKFTKKKKLKSNLYSKILRYSPNHAKETNSYKRAIFIYIWINAPSTLFNFKIRCFLYKQFHLTRRWKFISTQKQKQQQQKNNQKRC